jgi:hypothetical protein
MSARLPARELGLVIVFGFVLLSNSLAFQVSGILAISGFLVTSGVNGILVVILVDYVIVLLLAGWLAQIVNRFDRVTLLGLLTFGFAFVTTGLRLLFTFNAPGWLNYALLYIVAEQQWLTFPLIFWMLATDVFGITHTRRLFPRIASWGVIGKLLGIGLAASAPGFFSQWGIRAEEVLTLNVLVYLMAYFILTTGLSNVRVRPTGQPPETVRETLREGWGFFREVPAFRYLMVAVLVLALCDTLIEFRFLVVTAAAFRGAVDYQRFYSLYRLAVTVLAFGVQAFLTTLLVSRLHLKNVFLLLPVVVLLSAAVMMILPGGAPGLVGAIGGLIALKLFRDTVDESARKSLQALVPEERRGRISTFMDGYLPAVGTIVGCVIGLAIVLAGLWLNTPSYFYIYLGVAVAGALVALWALLRMRAAYDSSLLNRRMQGQPRPDSVLDGIDS